MIRTVITETEDTDSSSESDSLVINIPCRMSYKEVENSSSVSVTSGDVVQQIRAVTDPLVQNLEHLFEFMRELRNEQCSRRHEQST